MSKDLLKIKYRQETVGIRTYRTKYIAEITHSGLNDYKVLTDYDEDILRSKVDAHVARLEEKWNKLMHKDAILKSKEEIQKDADEKTRTAILKLKDIDNILLAALEVDDKVDWDQLKNKKKFDVPSPEKQLNKLLSATTKPSEPSLLSKPIKPNKSNFDPKLIILVLS